MLEERLFTQKLLESEQMLHRIILLVNTYNGDTYEGM